MNDRKSLPEVGAVVAGRYAIRGARGEGMMGAVLEAEDLRDGSAVALKVLRPAVAELPIVAARLEREGRMAARLTSPHVVRVLDVGVTDAGLPFVAMELLEGHDLGQELARGPLPIGRAVHLVRQACLAVAEAHERGIVHRDLKPSNLFVTRDAGGAPVVKVLDFGISKSASDGPQLTVVDATLGTPIYMSPEQIRSPSAVDGRSDVWSLAVVLFELVTGRAPFEGETGHAVAAAIVADEPPALRTLSPGAPEGLERVIANALQKDPGRRTATAGALRDALAPFDDAAPRAPASHRGAPPVAAGPPARPPMSRAVFWVAVGTGLALGGLVLAAIVLTWRRVSPYDAPVFAEAKPTFRDAVARSKTLAAEDWRACVLSAGPAPSLPAAIDPGKLPEPIADLDAVLASAPKRAIRLELPFGDRARRADDIVLVPVTPLSVPLRSEEPAAVLVVTDRELYLGLDGTDVRTALSTAAEIERFERLVPQASAWIVAAEGDVTVERLAGALDRLEKATASVTLAVPVDAGAPPSAPYPGGAPRGCKGDHFRGAGVDATNVREVERKVREIERRCAEDVPAASGTAMDLVLRLSGTGSAEACVAASDLPSVKLSNCVVHGIAAERFPTDPVRSVRVASFRLLFRGPTVRAVCPHKSPR